MATNFQNNADFMQNLQIPNMDENNQDLKKSITFISLQIADLGYKFQKVDNIKSCADTINEIANVIKTGNGVVENATSKSITLQDLVNKLSLDNMKNQCSQLLKPFLDTGEKEISQAVRDQIAKQLEKAKIDMACEVIKNGASISAIIIAVQVVKICAAWQNISKAENVVEDSRTSFDEINENITKLMRGTEQLVDKMAECDQTTDERIKMRIATDVHHETTSLSSIYIDTKDLISDIKLKISGQIERVNLCADEQVMDGITNAVQGIANLVQYCRLGDMLTTNLKIIQGSIAAAFFALATFNAATYVMSHKTLKELRETMRPLVVFDRQLRNLRTRIQEAENWYIEHCRASESNSTV